MTRPYMGKIQEKPRPWRRWPVTFSIGAVTRRRAGNVDEALIWPTPDVLRPSKTAKPHLPRAAGSKEWFNLPHGQSQAALPAIIGVKGHTR